MGGWHSITQRRADLTGTSSGNYMTDTKLIIKTGAGDRGRRTSLIMSFKVTEKPYTFKGTGNEDDPSIVDSAVALYQLGKRVNNGDKMDGQFILQTADIDMTGVSNWTPIGLVVNNSARNPLKATYDGGGRQNHELDA